MAAGNDKKNGAIKHNKRGVAMETNEINAIEAIYYYQSQRETDTGRPENAEQQEINRQQDAYKVELSDAAIEQREFIEAERARARLESDQGTTYNASAKIGG